MENWIANTEDVTKFDDNKHGKKGNTIVKLKSDEAEARAWNELPLTFRWLTVAHCTRRRYRYDIMWAHR